MPIKKLKKSKTKVKDKKKIIELHSRKHKLQLTWTIVYNNRGATSMSHFLPPKSDQPQAMHSHLNELLPEVASSRE